jgi:hypothetical protein
MPLGNGQTQRLAQSSGEDWVMFFCSDREESFTCAMPSDHLSARGAGIFFSENLKDLGS